MTKHIENNILNSNVKNNCAPEVFSTEKSKNNNVIHGKEIKSPMVGTFYRSASPQEDSYVKEGQKVKKGDILCIIEAMKIMNKIESDIDGKIVKILSKDGDSVQFDQPLFIIQ